MKTETKNCIQELDNVAAMNSVLWNLFLEARAFRHSLLVCIALNYSMPPTLVSTKSDMLWLTLSTSALFSAFFSREVGYLVLKCYVIWEPPSWRIRRPPLVSCFGSERLASSGREKLACFGPQCLSGRALPLRNCITDYRGHVQGVSWCRISLDADVATVKLDHPGVCGSNPRSIPEWAVAILDGIKALWILCVTKHLVWWDSVVRPAAALPDCRLHSALLCLHLHSRNQADFLTKLFRYHLRFLK